MFNIVNKYLSIAHFVCIWLYIIWLLMSSLDKKTSRPDKNVQSGEKTSSPDKKRPDRTKNVQSGEKTSRPEKNVQSGEKTSRPDKNVQTGQKTSGCHKRTTEIYCGSPNY